MEKNFQHRVGEIDLILVHPKQKTIVFVEVKYRSNTHFGGAAYAIQPAQLRRVQRSAARFLQQHQRFGDYSVRFDAILFQSNFLRPNWIRGL